MKYKAVLFDFDGVVINSMHQHYDAWSKAFKEKEVFFSKEDFFQMDGQGIHTIAKLIGERFGLSDTEMLDIVTAKVRYYYKSVKIEFYPHFFEVIRFLKENNIPMAVVTGGNRERVAKTIQMHLNDVFNAVVTVDDVENGKPHPEPFIKGAQKLGFDPRQCVVVENAPLGIKAAKAAGCKTIALQTTLPESYLQESDRVCNDFFALDKLFQDVLFNN